MVRVLLGVFFEGNKSNCGVQALSYSFVMYVDIVDDLFASAAVLYSACIRFQSQRCDFCPV
jgi:hypothetical protein